MYLSRHSAQCSYRGILGINIISVLVKHIVSCESETKINDYKITKVNKEKENTWCSDGKYNIKMDSEVCLVKKEHTEEIIWKQISVGR